MQKLRKKRVARVISNKMDKTAVVQVEIRRPHRLYKRIVKQISKFKVHDEKNDCQIGDMVHIMEFRPVSKEKRWIVTDIISRKEVVEVLETEIEIPKAKVEPVEVKAEDKPKKTKAKAKAEPEAEAETEIEAKPKKTKAKAKAEPEAEAETEAEDKPKKTKAKAKAEPEAEAETETEVEAEDQ